MHPWTASSLGCLFLIIAAYFQYEITIAPVLEW